MVTSIQVRPEGACATMNKEEAVRAAKDASLYFQKFDKSLLHHAAAIRETEWLLCPRKEQQTDSTAGPQPLLHGLSSPDAKGRYVIAIPHSEAHSPSLKAQELQQLVRELVEGLYVFNQTPSISLQSNHDSSTTCALPSAYADTLVGQTMLSVDYFIKSLLHGTTVAQKEKRSRLNEEWRKTASDNPGSLHDLYLECGMTSMEDDEELGPDLYSEERLIIPRYPAKMVDTELTNSELAPRQSTGEEQSEHIRHISRDVFLRDLEHVGIGLALLQKSVQQDGSLLVFSPSFEVITFLRPNLSQEKELLAHLHVYLQKQREFILRNLQKSSVAHDLELLGFISFMVLLLATLKHRNKIIDCSQLVRRMNKDVTSTDRELPPFLPSKNTRWSPFTSKNHYCSANGEIVLHKQPVTIQRLDEHLRKHKDEMAAQSLEKGFATYSTEDASYFLLILQVEEYYPRTPKLPRWVHSMVAELRSQCAHVPSINASRVQDFLRKPLGPRTASKLKTTNDSLVPCIEKGLLAPLSVILRHCTKTRISKPSEEGMALIHYAALQGQADVLSLLLHAGADPNQGIQMPDQASSSTSSTLPIHLAAKSGSLDAVGCLVKAGALVNAIDADGWASIHHAAFHNYHHIVADLVSVNAKCINAETCDTQKSTPFLLVGHNGGLDTVKCLVRLGADLTATDSSGRNIVHITALKNHVSILKFFADLDSPDVLVWAVLTEMLSADPSTGFPSASACALDALFHRGSECCANLVKLQAIPKLVHLLKQPDEMLQHKAVQVLADISSSEKVKDALVEADAIPHLVKLLSTTNNRIHSCTCLILCDLGLSADNQQAMTKVGVLQFLVQLLSSPDEDVQMNACACLGILASENPANKTAIRENKGVPAMVTLLSSQLMCVQGCAASSLKVLLEGSIENQLEALSFNIATPLVALLRSKSISVQCAAAQAMEALSGGCPEAQAQLLEDRFQCTVLLRRLLKARDSKVKVCGATALWALAGSLINNKRKIANFMGIDTLVDLLASQVEKLVYVCSEALGILASELGGNQFQIAHLGGITPLTDVLLSRTSPRAYISIMHTLGFLLTKPGLVPNPELQKMVANSRGVTVLSSLMLSPMSPLICVEAACTLAKLVLGNSANEKLLAQQKIFSYLVIFKFLASEEPRVRLLAGYALSVFVFNNPKKQQMFKSHGSINISNFTDLLTSEDSSTQAYAAFQLVTLSKLICGTRDVDASIHGMKLLIQLCASSLEQTKILCGEFLACLARCKDGIPTAAIMAGALDPLLDNLYTNSPPVIESSCAAIGFFTYLPLASRLIRGRFRLEPELYQVLHTHLPNISVSKSFTDDWSTSEEAGLPSLSLEKRGGPAIGRGWKEKHQIVTGGERQSSVHGHQSAEKQRTSADDVGLLMRRKLSLTT